jgi:hypothetical protein
MTAVRPAVNTSPKLLQYTGKILLKILQLDDNFLNFLIVNLLSEYNQRMHSPLFQG